MAARIQEALERVLGKPADDTSKKQLAAHHVRAVFLMDPWECVGSERMNLQIPCRKR